MINTRKSFKFTPTDKDKRIEELEQALEGYKENTTWCDKCKQIADLKQQIEKMKQDLDNARENANKQEQWEIYSVLNDIYNDNFEVITNVSN